MRKLIIILLAILFAFSATAESDMAGLTTEDLITLRDALNHELALRSKDGTDAQIVDVDGLLISIDSVYIGTGNDDVSAICILFNISNPTDTSKKMINDIGCDILQDGMLLDGTAFRSDTYKGPSPASSLTATIAPGVVDMKLCQVGAMSGDGKHFTVILSRQHLRAGEDGYCGTFEFDLSDYIND